MISMELMKAEEHVLSATNELILRKPIISTCDVVCQPIETCCTRAARFKLVTKNGIIDQAMIGIESSRPRPHHKYTPATRRFVLL